LAHLFRRAASAQGSALVRPRVMLSRFAQFRMPRPQPRPARREIASCP
jgi:hypothetical protein